MLCTLNLPLPVSRAAAAAAPVDVAPCPHARLDLIIFPCQGIAASAKGLGALVSVQSFHGYLKPMSKHWPNPLGTAAFFHLCMSETSTKPH